MAKQNNTVVGVFINEAHAQGAIQKLRSAGLHAHIAEGAATQVFKNTGLEAEVVELYESRMSEGNTIVMAHPGRKSDEALDMMLDSGAEYINLNTADSAAQANVEATDQAAQETRTSTAQNVPSLQAARNHLRMEASERQYGQVDRSTGRAKPAGEMYVQLGVSSPTPGKVVQEKQEEVPVSLRHEDVTIEGHVVNRPAGPNDVDTLTNQVLHFPIYAEVDELQKNSTVRE